METDDLRHQVMMQDEIDLRPYLRVLWKHRFTIVLVTVAAMLVGGLLSLLAGPVYEARGMILVTKPSFQVGAPVDPSAPGLKIGTILVSDLPTETLVAFARSAAVKQRVVKRISSNFSRVSDIGVSLFAQTVRNTNLVELTVRGKDPVLAARVANEWARIVAAESEALFSAEAQQSFAFFDSRLQEATRQLGTAERALRDFHVSSEIGVLQARVRTVTEQIASYESRLVDISVVRRKSEAELAQTETQLRLQPRTLTLSKSITNDPLLHRTASEVSQRDFVDVSKLKLRSEELNPVYMNLTQTRANLRVNVASLIAEGGRVERALETLSTELDVLRGRLARQEFSASQLARAVDHSKQVYDVLLQRREESRVASANQVGSVKLATEAITPEDPVGPRKILNMLLAGVLGLMVGVASAFVREYSGRSAPQPVRPATTAPPAMLGERLSKP